MIEVMSTRTASLLDDLRGRELAFGAGEPLFHLGDPVQLVHIVRTGVVHLIRHQDDGPPLVLQRAGPGSILAEASVYSTRYHCDARVETAATIWAVSRGDLRKRLAESPDFSNAWAEHLAQEVHCARFRAELLTLKTVAARLNAWIAMSGALPHKGQWLNVALEIGVSHEALYRELAKRR